MAQGSTYHLHDRHLNGEFGPLLLRLRDEVGLSAEDIAFTLRTEHDIRASSATVLRWVAIARSELETGAA